MDRRDRVRTCPDLGELVANPFLPSLYPKPTHVFYLLDITRVGQPVRKCYDPDPGHSSQNVRFIGPLLASRQVITLGEVRLVYPDCRQVWSEPRQEHTPTDHLVPESVARDDRAALGCPRECNKKTAHLFVGDRCIRTWEVAFVHPDDEDMARLKALCSDERGYDYRRCGLIDDLFLGSTISVTLEKDTQRLRGNLKRFLKRSLFRLGKRITVPEAQQKVGYGEMPFLELLG